MFKRIRILRLFGTVLLAAAGAVLLAKSLSIPVQASPGDLFASPLANGDCSQASPCTLQTALGQAVHGDAVNLSQGTYTSTADAVATITRSITLYGGWDGTTTSPPVRDPQTYTTILDGEGQRRVVYIDGQYIPDGPTLIGLRLINGAVTGNGGAISSRWTSPIISGCQILTNTASNWGGGIYSDFDNNVTLTGNKFHFNSAGSGGGIYLRYSGGATLVGNDVYSNSTGVNGGGVYIDHTHNAILTDNDIHYNTASAYGGGSYILASNSITLTDNRIYYNTVQSNNGGGFYSFDSDDTTLMDNQIHHNTAESGLGGGGSFINSNGATLTDNTIYSNTASGNGGGVYFASSPDAALTGNDIYRNTTTSDGAGVYFSFSDRATLENNQVFMNTAVSDGGGGLELRRSPTSTLTNNNIYSNTAGGYGGGIYLYDNDNTRLTGNWIHRNTVGTWHGGGINLTTSDNVTLVNNMVLENRLTGSGNGAGIVINNSTVHAVHTTLAHNNGGNGQGVYMWNGGALTMTNTILVSHTVGLETSGGSAILTATLWGEGPWANITATVGGTLSIFTGTINIEGDPAFVDPDGGDYHILPGSAAFNQGVGTDVVRDYDGETRVGAPDLGADEYVLEAYLPLALRNYQ